MTQKTEFRYTRNLKNVLE